MVIYSEISVNMFHLLKEQDTLALRKEGLGVVLDSALPHLIGIDDDILSTGIMLYHLKVRKYIYSCLIMREGLLWRKISADYVCNHDYFCPK